MSSGSNLILFLIKMYINVKDSGGWKTTTYTQATGCLILGVKYIYVYYFEDLTYFCIYLLGKEMRKDVKR